MKRYSLIYTAILTLLFSTMLTACGGGGGGGGDKSVATAPVANAGLAQSVITNTTVTLDGSASSDANGDTLTYSWILTSKPNGSGAILSSATVVKPTFTADVAGDYVLNLIVNDGQLSSAAATVTVTAAAPTVAQVVALTVGLQGSATVGAVDVVIVLPASYTLAVDEDGQPTAAALSQLLNSGTNLSYAFNYLPASSTLIVGIIKSDGFMSPVDLFKINRTYAVGATLPVKDDFAVTVTCYDFNGALVAGVTKSTTLIVTPAP